MVQHCTDYVGRDVEPFGHPRCSCPPEVVEAKGKTEFARLGLECAPGAGQVEVSDLTG